MSESKKEDLYDEVDYKWFMKLRKDNKNIKFFTLRDCELLAYELLTK